VIDAWGEVLAEQAQGPGVVMARCDVASLQARRSQLPALEHRILL
jgi:deaminated glutathione amidase